MQDHFRCVWCHWNCWFREHILRWKKHQIPSAQWTSTHITSHWPTQWLVLQIMKGPLKTQKVEVFFFKQLQFFLSNFSFPLLFLRSVSFAFTCAVLWCYPLDSLLWYLFTQCPSTLSHFFWVIPAIPDTDQLLLGVAFSSCVATASSHRPWLELMLSVWF